MNNISKIIVTNILLERVLIVSQCNYSYTIYGPDIDVFKIFMKEIFKEIIPSSRSNGYLIENVQRLNDLIFNNFLNQIYDVNYGNTLTSELYNSILATYESYTIECKKDLFISYITQYNACFCQLLIEKNNVTKCK